MFALNYASPKSGRAVRKEEIRSPDNNPSLASVCRVHVASNGVLDCWLPELQLCAKPHFMAYGEGKGVGVAEGVGSPVLWQRHCSFHLSIFIIAQLPVSTRPATPPQPTAPRASLSGAVIHDALALVTRRRVHHRDFSQASVSFNPKSRRGEARMGREGGRWGETDGWKSGRSDRRE